MKVFAILCFSRRLCVRLFSLETRYSQPTLWTAFSIFWRRRDMRYRTRL
jgi:hypothetical protein